VQILITRLNRDVAFAGDIPDSDFRQNTCTADAVVAGRGDLLAASRK
jgi:hypothetical protein